MSASPAGRRAEPAGGAGLALLLACFFLSGLAGLVFETAWTQQFALVFGTSELALATVLAAYMGGLALGAAAAGRWARRLRRPLLAYALLELGIGGAALAVPAAIGLASRLHVALFGGAEMPPEAASAASALYYLASSFAILLVPTALMGATLPILARWAVRREEEIGSRVGLLYTANTAGAACGTLAAAFLLLPRIGLGRTVLAGAAVNLAVFALAALLARRGRGAAPAGGAGDERPVALARAGRWVLPLILVSGAVSFSWEILWTRLLAHLLGGSVYAFATMLATFLAGIALGSAAAARLASTAERARIGFAATQMAIAALSLAAFAAADRLPALAQRLGGGDSLLAPGVALCAATLLPGALAIGATFPFAVRCLARGAADASAASARVFAWNTVGAILGSLATGYLLLPALGFAGLAAAAAAVSLVLGLAAALAAPPRRKLLAAAAAAGLALVALARPATPWAVLRSGPLSGSEMPGEVVHFAVGRSSTVLLLEQNLGWRLATNGLPESFISAAWARPYSGAIARWLTLLPLAARPEARSLLVVGLGGGVMVEEVPASVEEIHVVELEPEVIAANRRAAAGRARDPLADPRLVIHLNDARGALRLTERRFDAIVSQPSHPWTSGASNLFTREFFELVRRRLTPDGVFLQWMGLPFVDEVLLRSLVATAVAAFPQVEVYLPAGGAVLILASAEPLELASEAERALASAGAEWARLGVFCREDLVAARVLDAEGSRRFAAGAPVSTDAMNLLRIRSPRVLGNPLGAARAERLLASYEPLADPPPGLDLLYVVRRLIAQGSVERARRLGEALDDPVASRTAAGLTEIAAGRAGAGEFALREALEADPDAFEALHGMLALYRPAIARGESVRYVDRLPGDPSTAVVAGWRLRHAGDWAAVSDLEERLAAAGRRHPLFGEAVRLRAGWRVESGEPGRAAEAAELLDALLPGTTAAADLILRARAAAAAGRSREALASLDQALPRVPRGTPTADEVWALLRSLPAAEATDGWRRDLEERLLEPPRPIRPLGLGLPD